MARSVAKKTSYDELHDRWSALTKTLSDETKRADESNEVARKWKSLADEREKIIGEKNRQITDLKERLVNAESENQRMRGYIQRVQEDDVVREDTVTIGDPNGEQQMVPKRKHIMFPIPSDYSEMPERFTSGFADRERKKPKHWVTY